MVGSELIKMIEENYWHNTELWISVDGNIIPLNNVEPLFPRLLNTNEIVLKDTNDIIQDEKFWLKFYESYMRIITLEEADKAVLEGSPDFYILYCDGTEGQIDSNISKDDWEHLKKLSVMFGYES